MGSKKRRNKVAGKTRKIISLISWISELIVDPEALAPGRYESADGQHL
jgi:hypothetical protein